MIPTCIPTSAAQKEAFPLAGLLDGFTVNLSKSDIHLAKNSAEWLSKVDIQTAPAGVSRPVCERAASLPAVITALNEVRLTVIRVSNEARLGVIAPTQPLTILKMVSIEEPQPLKSYGLHWLDHYRRNPCYIQPVPAKSGTGIETPKTPKATNDAKSVYFFVDATAQPLITAQIRTESMAALAGLSSDRPVSFVSGSLNPVSVAANHDIETSGGDSLNTKEAAIWLLPPPKNRLLSGAFTHASNPAISLLPLALNPKPVLCYPIAHACLLLVFAQGALMLKSYDVPANPVIYTKHLIALAQLTGDVLTNDSAPDTDFLLALAFSIETVARDLHCMLESNELPEVKA